jgi:SAM-dependent methyltransferase
MCLARLVKRSEKLAYIQSQCWFGASRYLRYSTKYGGATNHTSRAMNLTHRSGMNVGRDQRHELSIVCKNPLLCAKSIVPALGNLISRQIPPPESNQSRIVSYESYTCVTSRSTLAGTRESDVLCSGHRNVRHVCHSWDKAKHLGVSFGMSIESSASKFVNDVRHHNSETWAHVAHGNASLAEYAEAGTEAVVGGAVVAALGKIGLSKCWPALSKAAALLPKFAISTSEGLPSFSNLAESIPAAAARVQEASPPTVRNYLYTLRIGERFKMTASGDDIFQVDRYTDKGVLYHNVDRPPPHFDSQLLNHDAYVRTGPGLLSNRERLGIPPHIPSEFAHQYASRLRTPFPEETPRWQTAAMTKRERPFYQQFLEIPDEELAPGKTVVEIGSGAKQEFARSVEGARVISVDPGLALSEAKDLERLGRKIPQEYRLEGRRNPHPLTLAAVGDRLPLPDHSVDSAYASFSLPMYSQSLNDIPAFLNEVRRVVKPGGTARIYPVETRNLATVEKWIASNRIADHDALKFKPLPQPKFRGAGSHLTGNDGADYTLLTLRF